MAFNESDDKELSPQSYLHSLRCLLCIFQSVPIWYYLLNTNAFEIQLN
ncbi:unnamed protein product [Brassica rapa subsp. narinosa]